MPSHWGLGFNIQILGNMHIQTTAHGELEVHQVLEMISQFWGYDHQVLDHGSSEVMLDWGALGLALIEPELKYPGSSGPSCTRAGLPYCPPTVDQILQNG